MSQKQAQDLKPPATGRKSGWNAMLELREKTLPSAIQQASMEKYAETFATPFYVKQKLAVILRRTWLYYWRDQITRHQSYE